MLLTTGCTRAPSASRSCQRAAIALSSSVASVQANPSPMQFLMPCPNGKNDARRSVLADPAQRPGSNRSGSGYSRGSRLSAYGLNTIRLPAASRQPPSSTSATARRGSIHTGLYSRSASVMTAWVRGSAASVS